MSGEVLHPAAKEMGAFCLGILLGLISGSCPLPLARKSVLTIHPPKPLVERGGSIQLNCSMDCPGGKVQWEGLDTDLGNIVSEETYAVLTVAKAAVSMEGRKFCTGQCQGRQFQKKVDLKVYSLPDTLQLDSEPKVLVAGQWARLSCSASYVYPPGSLTLSWFRGDERLEASGQPEEKEIEDSAEQLFAYRSELEVPAAAGDAAYRCEAELEVERQTFRRASVAAFSTQAAQEEAEATEASFAPKAAGTSHGATVELSTIAETSPSLAVASGSLPPLSSSERPTAAAASEVTDTAAPLLKSLARTPSPTAVGSPSTGVSTPAASPVAQTLAVPQKPTARTATSTLPPATEAEATFRVTSLGLVSTNPETEKDSVSAENFLSSAAVTGRPRNSTAKQDRSTEDPCRPVITPDPPQGAAGGTFRITCHAAECSGSTRIRWVETPVALSRYHQEEAEGRSTLTVESVSLAHQGVYRCVTVASRPRIASLRVIVSAATFSTDSIVAVGTAGSLLGLMVTGYVSHRVRKQRGS